MDYEFDEQTKNRILNIIKRSLSRKSNLNAGEVTILYNWVRNVNDPCYAWVPEKYKKTSIFYKGE